MTPPSILLVITTLLLAATQLTAQTPKIPAACQPMVDAERKTITAPHHVYTTESAVRAGDKPTTAELISTGDANYILLNGKWRKSPMTTKETLAQMDENLATATAFSCQHVGDESVAATAAAVYTAHTVNEGVKADVRVWVAKGSGLVLRTEDDMDSGGGDKRHISVRYDYANVTAPAGAQ